MPEFKMLEWNIKDMLKGGHSPEDTIANGDATAKRILHLAKNMATHTLDMVYHKPTKPKSHSDNTIRMSELGEPCHRKLLYKWYQPDLGKPPYAENPEPFLPVKFTFGDYIEELTLFLASEAGHSVHSRQKEVMLNGRHWYAVGHMDAIIDDVVVDVKSAADGSYNKYKREGLTEETDTFGYLWQLDAYATAEGTDKRAFVFTNKHDGNMHIIDRSGIELLPVVSMIDRIGEVAEEYISTKGLPERMPPKVTKYGNQLGTVCGYCAFKWACYDGDIEAVISSGRPTYFVKSSLTPEGDKFVKGKAVFAPPAQYDPIPF